MRRYGIGLTVGLAVLAVLGGWAAMRKAAPVSSGRVLTPLGTHVGVGSFPCNMALSPDKRYLVVTDAGFREELSVIDTSTGAVTDKLEFDEGKRGAKESIYYGLAWGGSVLYVSRGTQGVVSRYTVSSEGKLSPAGDDLAIDRQGLEGPVAGLAVSNDGRIAVAVNDGTVAGDHHGLIEFIDPTGSKPPTTVEVPGYPLDVVTVGDTTYASCERDGVVVPIRKGTAGTPIKTGANPTKLTLSPDGKRLFVSNAGSDTVSVIDPATNEVSATILLRPESLRGLPISTPLAVSLDSTGTRLLVACGDLNAIAVVDVATHSLQGLIPAGWYPSAVAIVGDHLFVADAKGVQSANPNVNNAGPDGKWGKYPPNIIEGAVSMIDLPNALGDLKAHTRQVLENDRIIRKPTPFDNPGISHVIYIIKENRTYDQVFGDISEGNGDPSVNMFGKDVTPNQHALAERFTLLDNFYDCAEVSADGWNWSTSGMINEYTARNVVNNYSGRRPSYDFEGENDDYPPDIEGVPDVAEAPGGYLWDDAVKHGVSLRNYGFFIRPDKQNKGLMTANKRALVDLTDTSFDEFDLSYADSDMWESLGKTGKRQKKTFGAYKEPCRFDEWKREFDGYVKAGKMPALMLVRFMRDHTAGTAAGQWSPRAMVADNDYAVGKLVEAVSHSPFWKSTAICILEDDAQNGFDHVDCHRSTALVISPYMERGRHDSRFYNTDSMLRTIEAILGMPPMNGFDATADVIGGLTANAGNDEPFTAIRPSDAIAGELNSASAYRAADSARLIALDHEESAADIQLNDILWGALEPHKAKPPIRGSITVDRD